MTANGEVTRLTGELMTANGEVTRLTLEIDGDGTPENLGLKEELRLANADVTRLTGELMTAKGEVTRLTQIIKGDGTPGKYRPRRGTPARQRDDCKAARGHSPRNS